MGQQLRTFIRPEGLTVGDSLPGESDLARQLEVSRNVVREALSRLRMLGLMASRKRRGMIVAKPDVFSGLERIIDTAVLDEETARERYEMRVVLELGLAEIVAARATDDDCAALDAIATRETAMIDNPERRVECDIA